MKYGPKKDKSLASRIARFDERQKRLQSRLSGNGRYKFQNRTNGSLDLPKPAEDGRVTIVKDGNFIGDSYFLTLVPEMLTIVEDLSMSKTQENKLMTEQPPLVTREGKVEFVQQTKQQTLTESKPGKAPDLLLTEDPAGGIVVLEE